MKLIEVWDNSEGYPWHPSQIALLEAEPGFFQTAEQVAEKERVRRQLVGARDPKRGPEVSE